eukprot:TRINITY_DN6140_c0_g2_i1.p1 TRINITY_DN6140_c0_g2~~TRINITY_DN6140_c0_g2_i1.p1  ORF type:complete len:583 (+),score=69.63 TRINITY_DN6140_c0_g2_i1:163-1911(+)
MKIVRYLYIQCAIQQILKIALLAALKKQCETCLNNVPSFSDINNLQTYGKCNCPEGFFASGFTILTCIDSSNLVWATQNDTIQAKTEFDQEFYDTIFIVLQIDQLEVYSDYIVKLKALLQTSFDSGRFVDYNLIFKIMNLLKDKNQLPLYQNLYDLIVMISNQWINQNECDQIRIETLLKLILDCYPQITHSTLRFAMYQASTINYAGRLYTKCFPTFPFSYNDHLIQIQTTIGDYKSENITITFSQNIELKVVEYCLTQSGSHEYYQQINIMNKESNPSTISASYQILSEKLIDINFICRDNMQQAQMNFNVSDYIYISFPEFSIDNTMNDIQCVQYNAVSFYWQSETNGQQSNECYFKPQQNIMGIIGSTNTSECPAHCYTCKNSICLACKSNYYKINNECISRTALKLDDFFNDWINIYILSLETGKYLGAKTNGEFEFYDSHSNEIANEQLQWKIKMAEPVYEFLNVYNQEIKFSYNTESFFYLNKLQDNEDQKFLYGNIVQLKPQSGSQCIDNTFQLVDCLIQENQLWEFLPVQTNLNQAIEFTAEFVADSDQIEIEFQQYKEDVVYVVAKEQFQFQ